MEGGWGKRDAPKGLGGGGRSRARVVACTPLGWGALNLHIRGGKGGGKGKQTIESIAVNGDS